MSLFAKLDRGLTGLYRVSGYAAAAFLVLTGLLVLTSIVSRLMALYVPGLTEFSGYAMAASSFLALAHTFERHGHIRVELAISRLGESKRRYAELWCLLTGTVVSALLAAYMCKLTYWSWKFGEHSEGSDAILLWKPQLAAAAGACILSVCVAHHLVRFLLRADSPADGRP